jgi:predicted ester cyclase
MWDATGVPAAPARVVAQFVDAFNAHDAREVRRLVSDESCQRAVISTLERFPDVRLEVRRTVVDGETVAVLARATGTHTKDLPGFAANGRRFSCRYQGMYRVEDGRIADLWTVWETLALLGQLEAPRDVLAGLAQMRAEKTS